MAKLKSETIILKGEPNLFEGAAAAVLKPGHVVQYTGLTFSKQSVALKKTPLRVVTEQDLIGKGIESTIPSGENVTVHFATPGHIVQAMLPASAAAIVKGDQLEMKGDGTLRKITTGAAIAEAWESLDNSANAAEVLIQVQAI
jgi:hypothetical protein